MEYIVDIEPDYTADFEEKRQEAYEELGKHMKRTFMYTNCHFKDLKEEYETIKGEYMKNTTSHILMDPPTIPRVSRINPIRQMTSLL